MDYIFNPFQEISMPFFPQFGDDMNIAQTQG